MPSFNNYVIDQLVAPALVLFFFVGALAAVAIGLGLIFNCAGVFRFFDTMNRSISTRNATKPLAVTRDSTQFFLKYRIPIGIIFVVGAVYADYGLLTGAGNAAIVTLFNTKLPPGYIFWIVESLRYFLMVTCTVSIMVGILMIISPDTLKAVETIGGRWISTRRIAPGAEKAYLTLDQWVAAFPRTAGFIILFPALGMTMYFGDQLLRSA